MTENGIVYIISAPSGTGKSTLINKLIQKQSSSWNKIQYIISYTTRNIRPTEINGKHYHFITIKKFKKMISKKLFFEYTQIFGHYYGTSKQEIEQTLNLGINIILDIDWEGMIQVKDKIPEATSIFLLPPSIQELKKRLYKRASDSKKNISERIKQAIKEINNFKKYDYIIINNDLNTALSNLESIIQSEKLRYTNQKTSLKKFINKLSLE